jgi:hypothetical protein
MYKLIMKLQFCGAGAGTARSRTYFGGAGAATRYSSGSDCDIHHGFLNNEVFILSLIYICIAFGK